MAVTFRNINKLSENMALKTLYLFKDSVDIVLSSSTTYCAYAFNQSGGMKNWRVISKIIIYSSFDVTKFLP